MMDRRWGIITALIVLGILPIESVSAQRGGLIEDLFRTWAETQINQDRSAPAARTPSTPQRVPTQTRPVPSPNFSPNAAPRAEFPQPGTQTYRPQAPGRAIFPDRAIVPDRSTPNPRLGSAWDSLHNDLVAISNDLRTNSSRQASLRRLVPDAFQLAARSEQLQRISAGVNAQQLADAYPEFDRDFRQFSFALRSAAGVSDNCRSAVSRCDQTVNRLGRYYSVTPQWDRQRFVDVVVMAQAHLQSLIDDLRIVSTGTKQCRHLSHDLDLLAGRLATLRPNLDRLMYDQVASEFNQFAAEMVPLAREIRLMRNPHLDLRLDRLRELADESYALLWMPPPIDQNSLVESAIRIEQAIDSLRDQLDARTLRELPSDSRRAIEAAVRTIDRNAHRLADAMKRQPNDDSIPAMLQQIDVSSLDLARRIGYLPGLHHASMATIRDETGRLLAAMRVAPAKEVLDYDALRHLASTLEGSAEYMRADIRRYERYLNPASYRSDLIRGSDEFFRAARDFHQAVDDRRQLVDLTNRGDRLFQAWTNLDARIIEMGSYGVPPSGAAAIMRYRNAMLEPIAGVAAMIGISASESGGRSLPR